MAIDTSLLNQARQMNTEALARIFDEYAPALFNYALRTGSDPSTADHIVGDVFAKLLDKFACGNGPNANLRSYLFEATYHQIVDEVRHTRRRVPIDVMDFVRYDGRSLTMVAENHALFEAVAHAIRDVLSETQRHVIILRFLEGFSVRETALILGKSANVVKVTQNRAIAALRKALCRHVVV